MSTNTTTDTRPIALVTGANRGIGLETVRRLAEAGYRVHLGARDPAQGKVAADGVGAEFLELDVTSEKSVDAAAEALARSDGRLDLLVHNAGISGPLVEAKGYTADDAAAVMLTN